MIDLFLNEPQRDCGMSSCVNLKTKLDMNTDQIVDSKVTTMTDLGGNKSKVLLLKDESEIEAFKEELRLCIVVGRSEQLVCNHPNERWKFDESGVDMYCEECAKNE